MQRRVVCLVSPQQMEGPFVDPSTAVTLDPTPTIPMPRSCPMRPPDHYATLREHPPRKVDLPNGRPAWLVTRHCEVRQLLTHPDVTAQRADPGFPLQINLPDTFATDVLVSLVGMDPPQHTAVRRTLVAEFTAKRAHAARERTQACVDAHLDRLEERGGGDLIAELALPVPSTLICELLGLPDQDRDLFISSTAVILDRNADLATQERTNERLLSYLDAVVTGKRREPTDDLLGRLVRTHLHGEDGRLDHDMIVGLARLLVVAGHEATPNMAGLAILALLRQPGLLARLRREPDLWPAAVDELLRYASIADQSTSRVALRDIEIGGVVIPAGDGIIGLNAAANWDPAAFDRPEVLDLDRPRRRHLAFGHGAHQCLGQNLARMHLEVMVSTLFDRLPGLKLAVALEQLEFKDDSTVYGLRALPVTC